MDSKIDQVAGLLHEAAETHHIVFRITEGVDDDWASWYSNWLVNMSELPELLDGAVVRSHLTRMLVELDEEYTEEGADTPWEEYYARRLLRSRWSP